MIERECTLEKIGEWIEECLEILPPKSIVLLRGDLASGKSTFVSAFAKKIGITQAITSPTFGVEHIYSNGLDDVFHYDFYQKDLRECLELGILEGFEREGWHFVEWGSEELEKILRQSGFEVVIITIEKKQNARVYRVN